MGIRKLEPLTAEVKRLLVASEARGQGLGNQLLAAAEVQARRLGYRTIVLDTDGSDHAALALFRRAGFSDTDDFNGNELARFWFRKDLC